MTAGTQVVPVPAGYRVGDWEVREPLGSGAFATVYAARRRPAPGSRTAPGSQKPAPGSRTGAGSEPLPARAALKFLPTGTPRRLRYLRELAEQEIALLSRLRTPRLVRLYEVLTVDDPERPELDGVTVLVLEQAMFSLDDLLSRTTVPPSGPAIMAHVCEGLHQLHHAGWVHGDLKAANILLMEDGSARLADFNMAAEMEGTHAYTHAFFTPDSTPPELLWPETHERGVRVRPTTDVWAFGVLAHLVLTGVHPLPGNSPEARSEAAVRYARGHEELRLSPELPDGWREIITDCLGRTHKERARHSTASLLPRVERAAGVTASDRLPRLRPRFWRRHPVLASAAALVLATIMGLPIGVHVYINQDDEGVPVFRALGPDAPVPTDATGKIVYGYDRCPTDSVCFFSERFGHGEMCSWKGNDDDWLSGDEACAWALDHPVRSGYNNLSQDRKLRDVEFFRGKDFSPAGKDRRRMAQRTGCNAVNSMANLSGTYAPRSHRLVDSCSSRSVVWTILSIFS
ncbi:protein kinase [Streptomyces sp. NPDC057682]|uniref:protein kinase domain-containing protein n=1 Tax=unclassified Streptomyces TaxID=2593676 RepID=UPI0036504B8A